MSPSAAGAAGKFVSRGGAKLDAALDAFGIEVTGKTALDAGASTGGFTDVLLQRGASHVTAADVAYGQLAWTLRNDERVTVLERTNVRHLTLEQPADIVVADLSFISLATVAGALAAACRERMVLLVKPQFEAPKHDVERGGVVRDAETWKRAVRKVADAYATLGFGLEAVTPSPLIGPAGNREFFVHLARGSSPAPTSVVDDAIERAP